MKNYWGLLPLILMGWTAIAQAASLDLFSECAASTEECREFFAADGTTFQGELSSRISLNADKAVLIKTPESYGVQTIFDKSSTEALAQFTQKYLNRKTGMVLGDELLLVAMIISPITDGNIFITAGATLSVDEVKQICLDIDPHCGQPEESGVFPWKLALLGVGAALVLFYFFRYVRKR